MLSSNSPSHNLYNLCYWKSVTSFSLLLMVLPVGQGSSGGLGGPGVGGRLPPLTVITIDVSWCVCKHRRLDQSSGANSVATWHKSSREDGWGADGLQLQQVRILHSVLVPTIPQRAPAWWNASLATTTNVGLLSGLTLHTVGLAEMLPPPLPIPVLGSSYPLSPRCHIWRLSLLPPDASHLDLLLLPRCSSPCPARVHFVYF